MLLGDLITAVSYDLPVKLIVFDNGRLGMVKLEQEQVGMPEFGTVLANPDFAAVARASACTASASTIRTTSTPRCGTRCHPRAGPARRGHQSRRGRGAGQVKVDQAWGFAIAKIRETVLSQGDS